MFTGIIQGSGKVKRLTMKGADAVLEIEAGIDLRFPVEILLPPTIVGFVGLETSIILKC